MICFNILYHFKCFKGYVPQILLVTFSSSLPTIRLCERSSNIAALKYFRKSPGKQPSWSLLLNFAEKESLWVFQYEFFKFFRTAMLKNTSERLFLEMSIFLEKGLHHRRFPGNLRNIFKKLLLERFSDVLRVNRKRIMAWNRLFL